MKYILLIVIFSGLMTKADGQGVNFVASYPIAFPVGKTSDYISKTSFRGLSLEVNKIQNQKLEVGLEASWNLFYEKQNNAVYTNQTASIKGIQFRYINAFPILAQVKANFGQANKSSRLAPYAGLGIGTMYVNQATDFGLYRITNEAWQFCLRPEVGLKFLNQGGPGGFIGVKYYAGFKSGDMDGQSYLSLNIGFIFPTER